jgi:hypothetical protein
MPVAAEDEAEASPGIGRPRRIGSNLMPSEGYRMIATGDSRVPPLKLSLA